MTEEEEQKSEPDFLDILDMWDEPLAYDDEDDDTEPFVPMYAQPWFKWLALLVAGAMIGTSLYAGLRMIFHW